MEDRYKITLQESKLFVEMFRQEEKPIATASFEKYSKWIKISSLVVWDENNRHKGNGKEFLKQALAQAVKAFEKREFRVYSADEAVGFYLKFGFRRAGGNLLKYIYPPS